MNPDPPPPGADRKAIFGWCMYDWANSAYILTVITAVLPVYFADVIVPARGVSIFGTVFSATSLWGFSISLSAFFVFLFAPVLGAIADTSASKKKFLMVFCYLGSLSAVLLFFCESGDVATTLVLVVCSQIGFVAGNVFYDAFLPHLGTEKELDWISGKGFAYGYIGGDLQFLASLGLIMAHDRLGLSESMAVRLALAMAGLWWGGFSIVTWMRLKEPRPTADGGRGAGLWAYVRIGFRRTLATTREVRQRKHLLLFLIAFMFYNEGIQTVIVMATIFGKQELKLSTPVLMVTLLIIQLVAMAGSLLFSKLAGRVGTKKAILATLLIWSVVVVYAYFMTTSAEYLLMGVVVGAVLGGSQSLSRSYYGAMIPREASAEFFGFYSVFTKFSAIWGPLVFGLINLSTGSSRQSIVSLLAFFVVGITLLILVDEKKAGARERLRAG